MKTILLGNATEDRSEFPEKSGCCFQPELPSPHGLQGLHRMDCRRILLPAQTGGFSSQKAVRISSLETIPGNHFLL